MTGKQIKLFRIGRDLTQSEFATLIGVTQNTVSRVECESPHVGAKSKAKIEAAIATLKRQRATKKQQQPTPPQDIAA